MYYGALKFFKNKYVICSSGVKTHFFGVNLPFFVACLNSNLSYLIYFFVLQPLSTLRDLNYKSLFH